MYRPCAIGCLLIVASLYISDLAFAEFQCAPTGSTSSLPTNDPLFAQEVIAWSNAIKSRDPEEGCPAVVVPGYEGFPTKRCLYQDADAGEGKFAPLRAEVIVLNPSARQLAAWSIHACRVNGAKDSVLLKCLENLRKKIRDNNGARFPVAGSVIESYCNSESPYDCGPIQAKRPRNTWFRDGVSVDYIAAQGVHWDEQSYSETNFDAVFDVKKSDQNLKNTFNSARIAAAQRTDWIEWRKHLGKPQMLNGTTGTVADGGWRIVAADVHRAACNGASNELFDAVVWKMSQTKRQGK
ncbi:hypothetical protein [Caballeronia cordobensis]|uniref:hypothetical protein n=1 Tax=Caballeronia cordobensis TaxID=1353886 RepID=UPI00045F04F5|nr:putative membrane protein [Burkholderia sp. RPE67]